MPEIIFQMGWGDSRKRLQHIGSREMGTYSIGVEFYNEDLV